MAGFNGNGGNLNSPFGQPDKDVFGQSFGSSDPFGAEGNSQFPGSAGPQQHSYVTSQVEDNMERCGARARQVPVTAAPWPVWVAALGYLAGSIQSGMALVEGLTRDRSYLVGWLNNFYWSEVIPPFIFLVVVAVGVVAVLKAQAWGRILLTGLSVMTILIIVWGNMWITTFIMIASAVFLWLPRNTRWFGYRRRSNFSARG